MNKARPTMSGSLIKHRAYLKCIKYNNNNNNNNNNSNISSSSSSSSTNNNEEEEEEINENFEMED
jgi:hypothetical protein